MKHSRSFWDILRLTIKHKKNYIYIYLNIYFTQSRHHQENTSVSPQKKSIFTESLQNLPGSNNDC